jgi:hypothetical protein
MIDQRETAERSEPRETKDPMAKREPKEPTDPIERTDPLDAMERKESCEANDHLDPPTICGAPSPSTCAQIYADTEPTIGSLQCDPAVMDGGLVPAAGV